MTAIFGGLFGLACITSVVALLIQVVPPKDDRSAAGSAAPSAKSAASARVPVPVEARKKKRTPIPGPWRLAELAKDPSIQIISGTPEKKSFVDALTDKGVPSAQVYRVMKALDGVRKFDKVGHKDKFSVALERGEKRVKAFEYEVTPSEIYQAREGNDGLLTGQKLDMKLAEEETVGAFYVNGDVEKSAEWGGFEDGILNAIDEAFQGRISHESFEEGSVVRVVAIEETALGLFSRYKRIVAVEYKPADPGAAPVRAYSFTGQESKGYFDDKGKQPFSGGWQPPLVGGLVVTSPFNPHRMHPVLHKLMPHEGTDLRAPTGTPIFSAYHGVVSSAGPLGPCGNAVVIDHPGGLQTGYCHMSKIAGDIKAGDKIGVHHQLGLAGQTGRASGPHLHFFAKKNGKFFDAMTLKLNGERVMPSIDRPAFGTAKAELDKRLEAIPMPEPPPEKPKAVAAAAPSGSAQAGPADVADKGEPSDGAKGDKPTRSARQVASAGGDRQRRRPAGDSSLDDGRRRRGRRRHVATRPLGTGLTRAEPVRLSRQAVRFGDIASALWRRMRWILLTLLALELVYLVVGNAIVWFVLCQQVNKDVDTKMSYAFAYSIWPTVVHVRDFRVSNHDSAVEWTLALKEGDLTVDLFALADKKFHARRIRADGVTFHLRQRLNDLQADKPRSRMLPAVPPFADPPMVPIGPPAPRRSDANYNLWTAELEDVDCDVDEVWIDAYRMFGNGRLAGAFYFKPVRMMVLQPTRASLRGVDLRVGEETLLHDVRGTVDVRIGAYDPRTDSSELARAFSADVHVGAEVGSLRAVGSLLGLGATKLDDGSGQLRIDAALDRGRLAIGSAARYETDDARARFVGLDVSAAGVVSLRAVRGGSDDGRASSRSAPARPDAASPPSAQRIAPRRRVSGLVVGLRGLNADLLGPHHRASGTLSTAGLNVPDLAWIEAGPGAAGAVQVIGGSGRASRPRTSTS